MSGEQEKFSWGFRGFLICKSPKICVPPLILLGEMHQTFSRKSLDTNPQNPHELLLYGVVDNYFEGVDKFFAFCLTICAILLSSQVRLSHIKA